MVIYIIAGLAGTLIFGVWLGVVGAISWTVFKALTKIR